MSYAERTQRPPRSLTDREVRALLNVTGRDRDGFRDHVLIMMALDLGLRESELVALDVGDVSSDGRKPKRLIQLREFKRAGLDADPKDQRCHLNDGLYYKLEKYLGTLKRRRPPRGRSSRVPLFMGRTGLRLGTRAVRRLFRKWQRAASFDQLYGFHTLRHTAITKTRRDTGSIRMAQRFARHANLASTTRYDHVSDEELAAAVKARKW
jgi:integrase/recombinase XerC